MKVTGLSSKCNAKFVKEPFFQEGKSGAGRKNTHGLRSAVKCGVLFTGVVSTLTGCQLDQFKSNLAVYDAANQTLTEALTAYFINANDAHRMLYFQDLKIHPDAFVMTENSAVEVQIGQSGVKGQSGVTDDQSVFVQSSKNDASDGDTSDKDVVEVQAGEKGYITLLMTGKLKDEEKSKADKGKRIARQTGLCSLYSDEAIKAHLHAINIVSQYSKALASISTTSAVDDAKNQLASLKDNVTKVAGEIDKLKGNGSSVAAIAGPVSGIAQIVGNWAIDKMQLEDIKKSIRICHGPMQELILGLASSVDASSVSIKTATGFVESDFQKLINRHLTTALSSQESSARGDDDALVKLLKDGDLRQSMLADFATSRLQVDRARAVSGAEVFKRLAAVENDLNVLAQKKGRTKKDEESWTKLDSDLRLYVEAANEFKRNVDNSNSLFKAEVK
ncbi:MAG: hypothetical protein EKK48_10145 [Candidatus Melainabacteria bacterium]|nr:MAG: hypothetical protein EKK48_10145 [Candidatus Melainabacteria bacterium]